MNTIEIEAQEFQRTILTSVDQHISPYLVRIKGREYVIFPETFNPNYAKASLLLLDNLGVQEGDVVLDPFTGSGADAIFAVLEGAERAVAIDKFTMPYLCARYNAHALGLDKKVDVRQGDLFDVLGEDEKFDLVLANPPFKRMDSHSNMESALRDEGYKTLNRFWNEIGAHLNPGGRIRAVFSNVGDIDYFFQLSEQNGFSNEEVASDRYASSITINVHEFRRQNH